RLYRFRRRHGALYFRALIDFDLITGLDIVVILYPDTTFGTRFHALCLILVPAQGFQLTFIDDNVTAQHANRLPANDRTVDYETAGDGTQLRGTEHILDLGQTDDFF